MKKIISVLLILAMAAAFAPCCMAEETADTSLFSFDLLGALRSAAGINETSEIENGKKLTGKNIDISGSISGIGLVKDRVASASTLHIGCGVDEDGTYILEVQLNNPLYRKLDTVITLNSEELGIYAPKIDEKYYSIPLKTLAEQVGFGAETQVGDDPDYESKAKKYADILLSLVNPENVTETEGEYKYFSTDLSKNCVILTISPTAEDIGAVLKALLTALKDDVLLSGILDTYGDFVGEDRQEPEQEIDVLISEAENITGQLGGFQLTVAHDEDGIQAINYSDRFDQMFFERFGEPETGMSAVLGGVEQGEVSELAHFEKAATETGSESSIELPVGISIRHQIFEENNSRKGDINLELFGTGNCVLYEKNEEDGSFTADAQLDSLGVQLNIESVCTEAGTNISLSGNNGTSFAEYNVSVSDKNTAPQLPAEKTVLEDMEQIEDLIEEIVEALS